MIKWLSKITITNKESDTTFTTSGIIEFYPPHVGEKLADSENLWEKPEYIFNELNINSVGDVAGARRTHTMQLRTQLGRERVRGKGTRIPAAEEITRDDISRTLDILGSCA